MRFEVKLRRAIVGWLVLGARRVGARRWAPVSPAVASWLVAEGDGFVRDRDAVAEIERRARARARTLEVVLETDDLPAPAPEAALEAALEATPEGRALVGGLDAYGHLSWSVGFGEEGDERGDFLAAADFAVGKVGRRWCVAYHVVTNSESGAYIQTSEQGIVPVSRAPYGILATWSDVAIEHAEGAITEDEVQANAKAAQAFDAALRAAIRSARRRSRR